MAKFQGYELVLESREEVESLVRAIKSASRRDPRKVDKTVRLAKKFAKASKARHDKKRGL